MSNRARRWRWLRRRPADLLLFGVTAVELGLLFVLTPRFTPIDWIYVCSNVLVLAIPLTRRPALEQDRSIGAGIAVLVSYPYSYAQVLLLRCFGGHDGW